MYSIKDFQRKDTYLKFIFTEIFTKYIGIRAVPVHMKAELTSHPKHFEQWVPIYVCVEKRN